MIDHGDGIKSWYAHLDGFNIKEGESVIMGQTIGFVGNTRRSTGPHLHFEIHVHDKTVDPLIYVK